MYDVYPLESFFFCWVYGGINQLKLSVASDAELVNWLLGGTQSHAHTI